MHKATFKGCKQNTVYWGAPGMEGNRLAMRETEADANGVVWTQAEQR